MPALLVPALVALSTAAPPTLPSALSAPLPAVRPLVVEVPAGATLDEGDEESAFIAGLSQRGLHEMVVREATKFLERRPNHGRADAVRYRRGDASFELGKLKDALADYRALDGVAGFEQAAEVKFRVGQCSLDLGENADAAKAFAAVRASDADYLWVPASYLLGEALFRSEAYAEAREAYASLLDAEGEGVADYVRDARYGIVWSAWKGKDLDGTADAAEAFVARYETDPRAGEVAFLAGEALLEAERPEDALRWYRRVGDGDHLEGALRGAAFALAATGDHEAAARTFGQAVERFPEGKYRTEAALQRGVELVRAGQFEGAIRALSDRALADDPVAHYWRATARSSAGDHEGAVADTRAGLSLNPDDELAAQLRIACGDALFELGRTDEAAEMYESSGSAYAVHAAAVARLNAGDLADAERLARSLLDGRAREPGAPFRAEALATCAEALFRLERYDDAERILLTLLDEGRPGAGEPGGESGAGPRTSVEPRALARALSRLAWCRWFGDDIEGARKRFSRVADDEAAAAAERAEARFMVGRCALAAGDSEGAREAFRAYLATSEEGPYAAESWLRLARLAGSERGASAFETLLERHPDSELAPTAMSELADLHLAADDFEAAARTYATLLERFPGDGLAPSARYGLGWARYKGGDSAGASEPLWAVARDEGTSDDLRVAALELLVWVERSAQRPALARAALMAFAPRVEDEARVLAAARVADSALAEGNDDEGRAKLWAELGASLQRPESIASVRIEQGFLALDAGRMGEARKAVDAARELSPESQAVAELSFFVGEAAFDGKRDEDAVSLYAYAAAHGTDDVAERALYKAGFAELRRGRAPEATAAFQSLVERFPKSALAPESMFLAGEACYRAGDDDAAVAWLRRMIDAAPEHTSRPKALFRLGLAEGRREEWRPSVDALATLVSETPEFPNLAEAELWRGRGHLRLEERRAARQSLGRVVQLDEGVLAARARIELGRLHEAENDDEGALAEYLKVAVLYAHDEECAEALVRAGDVLARTGDDDGATARYREVVSEYPETAWADEARERIDR